MNLFFDQVRTFFRIQFGRHLRSPALWFIALAGPLATRFMVPPPNSSYAVVAINQAYPILTPPVIGMEVGIISALILSPLAYVFLRAGPTRRTPWQVEDVSPAGRSAQMLGSWGADTAVLWLVVLCMALAGAFLSLFRLPLSEVRPHETILATVFICAPAFAFIASVRTLFSARPGLRGAGGDVLFFFVWMTGITIAAMFFAGGGNSSPIIDVLGYASVIAGATNEPIEFLAIGSSPGVTDVIKIDALRGVLSGDYLFSRLFWIIMSGVIAVCGGLIFKPRTTSKRRKTRTDGKASAFTKMADGILNSIIPKTAKNTAPLWTNIYQIFNPKIYVLLLSAAALAGVFLSFRTFVGPALFLFLLFPLTSHSARWQSCTLTNYTSTLPMDKTTQFIWRLCAAILVAFVVCIPAIAKAALSSPFAIAPDLMLVIIFLPIVTITTGAVTRSAFTARLLLLIVWYGYLNAGAL